MTSNLFTFTPDPTLDLVLEREIDVPVELVWEAWTTPDSIKEWFCPKPWSVSSCEIDLRPGGKFNTVMRSPEGQEFPNSGCYLEVVPNQRLVFTDTLLPGFRPAPKPFFTAALLLEPTATGTRYTAIAIHGNEETRKQHEEMGFHEGWGTVVDQLVAHIKASIH
ncbi:SRPBCC family protein [Sphingosinicella xenopeptidilytica]|uniref:SRPBCC family protein n=1 Tax=Sphingosinicella xenopeptidilytica TaxID=364098 RepID=A0ABW3C493_SPHXN